jgi:hypothetical protein
MTTWYLTCPYVGGCNSSRHNAENIRHIKNIDSVHTGTKIVKATELDEFKQKKTNYCKDR